MIISFPFLEKNIRKNQKKIDKGNMPVNPFDKNARNIIQPDKIRYLSLLVLIFFIAKRTEAETNIFIVFSKKLFEQAQLFKGIMIQKNKAIQL